MEVANALSSRRENSSDPSQVGVDPRSVHLARIAPHLLGGKLMLGLIAFAFICMGIATSFYARHRHFSLSVPAPPPVHKPLTFLGNAYEPAVSPDGKFVAYLTLEPLPQVKSKLMLQGLSGGPSLELVQTYAIGRPMWSPDGSELLIRMWERPTSPATPIGLFIVSRLGGLPRPLGVAGEGFCWSPDGLYIVASAEPQMGILLVNKQSGEQKKIPGPQYQKLSDIDWSAKTNMLLILTETSQKYQLWTMKPDGSEQRKLIEEQKKITSAHWSSVGDAIYYFRKEGETTDLVKLRISGQSTEPVVMQTGLESGDTFTLSADGTILSYTRTRSLSTLWLAELPGKQGAERIPEKQLTFGTLYYDYPSISPDGRWVTYTSGSNATSNIYKMAIDGGQPVQLTFFDAAISASSAWSPDSKRIAFICNQGGTPKVWVIDSDGGTARRLDKTNASDTDSKLAWSPSSEIIYQQPGSQNLRRLNVETQKEEPLLRADSHGWLRSKPIFSPDGKKFALFWARSPRTGLWVFWPETNSERLLSTSPYWALGWSPDGNFIYAGRYGGREVVKISLENSKQTKTPIILYGDLHSGTVSPDGRKIIVGVEDEKSDVWLIKDFDPHVARDKQSNR